MSDRHTSIGTRMKSYEMAYKHLLTPRSCLFIRVDGRAFHTYTKKMDRPFDRFFMDAMVRAAQATAKDMTGFQAAYVQSDECTFMLTDFDVAEPEKEVDGWFGYELNKVVSLSASIFTAHFNQAMRAHSPNLGYFDSRAFIVPKDDAANIFVWRQKDWHRNSIQMLARSKFSQSDLQGKAIADILIMLDEAGERWEKQKPIIKNGTFMFQDLKPLHIALDYYGLNKRLFGGSHEETIETVR